jgi:hypothetical protein
MMQFIPGWLFILPTISEWVLFRLEESINLTNGAPSSDFLPQSERHAILKFLNTCLRIWSHVPKNNTAAYKFLKPYAIALKYLTNAKIGKFHHELNVALKPSKGKQFLGACGEMLTRARLRWARYLDSDILKRKTTGKKPSIFTFKRAIWRETPGYSDPVEAFFNDNGADWEVRRLQSFLKKH